MKVKLKTLYASPIKVVQVDEISEFSDKEGMALVNGRFGISLEPIKPAEITPMKVEKAIVKPMENEIRPKNLNKKGKK